MHHHEPFFVTGEAIFYFYTFNLTGLLITLYNI